MAAFQSDMRRSDVIVAHNLPFDVHQVRESANGFDLLKLGKRYVDTRMLAQVVVPERRWGSEGHDPGFSLDGLSKTYLKAEDQKISLEDLAKEHGIRLKTKGGYRKLWEVEPEAVEEYAKQDTRATVELLPHLVSLVTPQLRRAWELERDTQPHLIRAEQHGVMVDQSKVTPLKVTYTEKRDKAYATVVEALGHAALGELDNPDSKDEPAALRDALLAHGVPLHQETPTGEIAVNKFALQEFQDDFPVIQALFDYRQASKFLSTYIGPMLGREVVHPRINQMGAWTSRMSMSQPNMQNIPVRGEGASALREMFIPRPGHVFVISDFDAIEVRLLAYYLNDPNYKAMIEEGLDPHAWMASKIWGGTPADFAKGSANDKQRGLAKNILFAITYGAGGGRVLKMLRDAGEHVESQHDAWYPGKPRGPRCQCDGCKLASKIKSSLPGYWKLAGRNGRVPQKVAAVGHVNTIMGRRQPVNRDKAYVGLNAIIQGSAAEIFKQAVINVAEATAHLGALPVMFVHDEIGNEVPIEHAKECQRLQDEAMRTAWDLCPRLEVTSAIAHNYAEGK